MARVNICNVVVDNNPASFFSNYKFEITFECYEDLKDDIEWKIIYVGSASSENYDQVLDSVLVGPVPNGRHMFTLEVNAPDKEKIPQNDVIGVTVILLTCSFREQEFIRVGYYVANEYDDPELRENPPEKVLFDKITRNVLTSDPRVTRFPIDWGDPKPTNEEQSSVQTDCDMDQETSAQVNSSPAPGAFAINTDSLDSMEFSNSSVSVH